MDPDLLVTGAVTKPDTDIAPTSGSKIKTETFQAYLSNNTGGGKVEPPTPVSGFCRGGQKHLVISQEKKTISRL
jgi:hypothetical protein